MSITIGHDAEVFLRDKRSQDYIPAIGLIGGSKEEPLPCNMGALQEDNVMAELNIIPAHTEEEFINNTNAVIKELKSKIRGKGLELSFDASAYFQPHYLDHPQAKHMGCEPDYNAYTMQENRVSAEGTNLRCCGGHIHIGWDEANAHPMNRKKLAVLCDLFLGIPSILIDKDKERKILYGKAGAHRPKEYGIEYRVLSNFWLKSDPLKRWVYRQAHRAVAEFNSGAYEYFDRIIGEEMLKNTIDSVDKAGAKYLIQKYEMALPKGVK